ncbi:MAG: HPr-rel-A system PqqD family peptide chaperone [Rhodoferax sp.]|nr:HPr-rel-A system PqqD family peptide chaperone [Rhodoferax sp.]
MSTVTEGLAHGPQRFLVRQWADGCVIFDRQSGNTHALDPMTFAVLEAIQASDNDPASVNAACHSYFPQSSADELDSIARECCERLEKCGLIPARPTR